MVRQILGSIALWLAAAVALVPVKAYVSVSPPPTLIPARRRIAAVDPITAAQRRRRQRPLEGQRSGAVAAAVPPVLAEAETWRQYVPLGVSAAVILDILLGSPLAHAALRAGRPPPADGTATTTVKQDAPVRQGSPERIDSQRVADDAVNRARNTLELRAFLAANKSDADRLRDLRRTMDEQAALLDQNTEALAAQIRAVRARSDQ